MKKEFEPGNVRMIITAIPERNLKKEEDIDKEAHRLERCLHFLLGYMGGDAKLYPERVYTGEDIVELLNAVIRGRE